MKHNFLAHRSAPLDCIRAAAVILVLIYHVSTMYDRTAIAGLDPVARWFAKYGFLGVDVFFPLSGFLIVRFLLGWTSAGLGKVFFLRRAFRIIPLYMLAVLMYLLMSIAVGDDLDILHKIWMTVLFLTGWFIFFIDRASVPFTITWSLSVEEFGYILLGLTAMAGAVIFRITIVALLVVPLVLRFYLSYHDYPNVYFFPPARLDSIALGAVVALTLHKPRWLLFWLSLCLAACAVLCRQSDALWETLLYSQIALATCIFIVLAEIFRTKLSGPIMTTIGQVGFYSYFIYLFHLFNVHFVFLVLRRILDGEPMFWVASAITLVITLVQAWLSFRYFEGPLMSYGRSLEGSPRPAAPAP